MRKFTPKVFLFCVCALVILGYSSTTLATPLQDYWPTTEWQISTPEEQGLRSREFDKMDNYIDSNNWHYYVDSLLVVKNGYIVYERYRTETQRTDPHHIYSCTKVITSTLVGICVDEGNITSLENSAMGYFPDYSFDDATHAKEAITIKHLLTMTAGLEWYDNIDYYGMMGSDNPVEYVFNQSLTDTPGESWEYNTGCSHVLSNIVERVSGIGTQNLAETALFSPLGITDYTWNSRLGVPNGGTLLYLKTRDMAKIGLFYLNEGNWNGTQIVSEQWVNTATSRIVDFNQPLYDWNGYGYQWWRFGSDDGYSARGTNLQHILVYPDLDMIIVSTGGGGFPFETLVNRYILAAARPSYLPWTIGGAGVAAIGIVITLYFVIKRVRIRKIKK